MGTFRLVKVEGKSYIIMSTNASNHEPTISSSSSSSANNNISGGEGAGGRGATGRLGGSVRRCLFGARTSTERAKEAFQVRSFLSEVVLQKSLKYNFDFENQRPLPGCYQWFKVPKFSQPSQQPQAADSTATLLLRVPSVENRLDFRGEEKEDEKVEGRLGEKLENRLDGRLDGRKEGRREEEEARCGPLSSTTSSLNISNNIANNSRQAHCKRVITDYFCKDRRCPSSSSRSCPSPPSPPHSTSARQIIHLGKRKKVMQDYFPIKKVKARN